MSAHLGELSGSYLMNTKTTGFRWFSKVFASLCFGYRKAAALKGFSHLAQTIGSGAEQLLVSGVATIG